MGFNFDNIDDHIEESSAFTSFFKPSKYWADEFTSYLHKLGHYMTLVCQYNPDMNMLDIVRDYSTHNAKDYIEYFKLFNTLYEGYGQDIIKIIKYIRVRPDMINDIHNMPYSCILCNVQFGTIYSPPCAKDNQNCYKIYDMRWFAYLVRFILQLYSDKDYSSHVPCSGFTAVQTYRILENFGLGYLTPEQINDFCTYYLEENPGEDKYQTYQAYCITAELKVAIHNSLQHYNIKIPKKYQKSSMFKNMPLYDVCKLLQKILKKRIKK